MNNTQKTYDKADFLRMFSVLKNFLPADSGYLFKSAGFLTMNQIVGMAFSFLTTYVFTNYAPKETYGSYNYILSIVGVLMMFSLPGMSNAITFSTAEGFEGVLVSGTRQRFKWSCIGALLLFFIAAFVFIEGRREIGIALALSAPFFPLAYGTDGYLAYLQGKKKFGQFCFANSLILGLISFGKIVIIFLYAHLSMIMVTHYGILALANIFFLFWFVKRLENRAVDNEFMALSRNMSLIGILGSLSFFANRLIMGTFFDMETMAIFSFALVMTEPFRTAGVFLNKITLPLMVGKESREVARALWRRLPLVFLATIMTALIMQFIFPYIISFFFPKYTESLPYIEILIWSSLLAMIGVFLNAFLYSQESLRKVFYSLTILSCILNILLNFVLILNYKIYGAVYASLILSIVGLFMHLIVLYKCAKTT